VSLGCNAFCFYLALRFILTGLTWRCLCTMPSQPVSQSDHFVFHCFIHFILTLIFRGLEGFYIAVGHVNLIKILLLRYLLFIH